MATMKGTSSPLHSILVIMAVIAGFLIAGYCFNNVLNRAPASSVDEEFSRSIDKLNETLPRMVDETNRLDSARYAPNRTEIFHYTALDVHSGQADPDAVNKALRPGYVESYRKDPSLKFGRDNGVTLIYQFFDADGNHITDIKVGPDDLVH